MCDCYETGEGRYYAGAVEEARAMIKKLGGVEAIRAARREATKETRKRNRETAKTRKELYDKYGYYDPAPIPQALRPLRPKLRLLEAIRDDVQHEV